MGTNTDKMKTALVLGAGGFIGSHMVKRLKSEGYWVRGVDLKYPEFSKTGADEFLIYDLRDPRNVDAIFRLDTTTHQIYAPEILPFKYLPYEYCFNDVVFTEVYQFAADMGGAGYIFSGEHDADVMHNSATINLNVCESAKKYGVGKIFYSSSACMYPSTIQDEVNNPGLSETDAYPALPDSEYGWEKLFSERLYLAYARNHKLTVRIARFHNIYGPEGTYKGGREKAPAAMCRKAIESTGELEVWGDGLQTRSFLYIDDCIDAVRLLMQSEYNQPVNIGSEEMVSINDLAQMAINLSGKYMKIKNVPSNSLGVRGRNSNNNLLYKVIEWRPKYSLKQGMKKTFNWIKSQYGL